MELSIYILDPQSSLVWNSFVHSLIKSLIMNDECCGVFILLQTLFSDWRRSSEHEHDICSAFMKLTF